MRGSMKVAIHRWDKWRIEAAKLPDWSIIAYLIIIDMRDVSNLMEYKPDEKFFSMVSEHANNYLEKGIMPPESIATAILNIADDHMAGKQITIRAGDYIALQKFMRK
jgi:hypothetical protein